eukprot:s5298_g2.t1
MSNHGRQIELMQLEVMQEKRLTASPHVPQDPQAPGLGNPHTHQADLLGVLPARSGSGGCAASFTTWAWSSLRTYPIRCQARGGWHKLFWSQKTMRLEA